MQTPLYLTILGILLPLLAIFLFYRASNNSKGFLILTTIWLAAQSAIALSGFYEDTSSIPPRFALAVVPTVVLMIAMFSSQKGRDFMDRLELSSLTWLHTIRIPVELMLFLLFTHKMVSEYQTVEGTNWDILSGLTAPLIAWWMFSQKKFNKKWLLAWNIFALLLVLNVVITAIFCIPSPFQKLAFDQPNIAVLQFPFNLLPSVIVPIVIFSHLAAIRKLLKQS